jgi:hypothetical protein
VLDYDEPFRHLMDWYLLKRGKSPKKALAPLPDGSFTQSYELRGALEPVKGLTKHPPIRVVIKDLKGWSLDRSEETRGIWIQSSFAWYKLMSPSFSVTDPEGNVTMHDLHVPFRAKFQLLSNLVDMFSEDDFRYLDVHISKTPKEVFDILSPNQQLLARYPDLNTMPFDFELLKRCPAFIKQHLTNLHPKLSPSCQFIQGLDQMEGELKLSKKVQTFDYMQSAFEAEKRSSREPHGDMREGAPTPRPNMLLTILKGLHSVLKISPHKKKPLSETIIQTGQAQPLLKVQTPTSQKANEKIELQPTIPEAKSSRKFPPSTSYKSSFPHKKRSRDIINLTSDTTDSDEEWYDDSVTPTGKETVSGGEERKSTRLSKLQPSAVKRSKQRCSPLSDCEFSNEKDNEADSSQVREQHRRGSVPKKIKVGSNQKVNDDMYSSSFDDPIHSKASASHYRAEAAIPTRQLQLKGPALEPIQVIFESNNVATEQQIKHTKSRELNQYLDVKEGGILKERAADFVADIVQAPKLASMVVVLVSIQALKKSEAQVHKQLFSCKKAENIAARIVFIRWFNKALQLMEDAGGKECMGSQIVVAILELMQEMKSVDCKRKLQAMAEKFEVDWLYCVDQAMALATRFKVKSVETACYVVGAYLRILPDDTKKERKTLTLISPEKTSQTATSSSADEKKNTNDVSQPLPVKRSNSSLGSQVQTGNRQREIAVQAKKQQQTRLASMLQQARVQCLGRSSEKKEQEEFSIGPWDPGFEALDQAKDKINENTGFNGWESPNKCSNDRTSEEMMSTKNWGKNKTLSSAWGSSSSWKANNAASSSKGANNSWSQAVRVEHPTVADEEKAYQSSEFESSYDATLPVKSWDSAVDDHVTNESKVLGGAWGSSSGWGTVKSGGWGQTSSKVKCDTASFSASLKSNEQISGNCHVEEDASGRADIQEKNRPDSIRETSGHKYTDSNSRADQFGGKSIFKSPSVISAQTNDSLKKSGCVWGASSGWNKKVAKDVENSSGGWGQKKRNDSSWCGVTKGSTASVLKGRGDQPKDSGINSESAHVAVDANVNSSDSSVLVSNVKKVGFAECPNATDNVKSSVSKSSVSAWGSKINKSSPSEATISGGLGQPWQGSVHKTEPSEKSNVGSNSSTGGNMISKNDSSVQRAWGSSSGWGTSSTASLTKASGANWDQAVTSRRSIVTDRETPSNIAASGSCLGSGSQNEAGSSVRDSNKVDAGSTKKSSGAWGSASCWATGSSKHSATASWGQTSKCSASSSATKPNVAVDITGKSNANKASEESVSASDIRSTSSKTSWVNDSSASASGLQRRESVPNVDYGGGADKGSKRNLTLPLPEDEEDGEISEEVDRLALPPTISEKKVSHVAQLRVPTSTSVATVTNNDVVAELSRGRGRGVDNRPAWMTSKGNETGTLDVEDRLSSTSSLGHTSGQIDEYSRPRGRGRGVCNLPAWQTHGDNVGNRSNTGQEDIPNNNLQVTSSSSHGPTREAAERAAQRERNREELRLDRQKYKVPREQYRDVVEEAGHYRQDERYNSSRGVSYSEGSDISLDPERCSDRGWQQPQGSDRSNERQTRRFSHTEDRRVESRQKDSERFHDGYDRSMQQQRWRK